MKKSMFLFFLFLVNFFVAQEKEETKKSSVGQFTFFYPLGTNGINSMDFSNRVSLNMLFGLNGGIDDGLELAGIFNFNKGNIKGIQFGGVANVNTGYVTGVSVSGVVNFSYGGGSGVFVSGPFSYLGGNSEGVQVSVVNITGGSFDGLKLGVVNIEGDVNGLELGVVNVSTGKVKGVQFGIINYMDDGEEGIPVGIISFARKNGYFDFELTAGEVLHTSFNYKMGVERFYTVYKIGYSYNNKFVFSYGLGFGTNIPILENSKLSIDLTGNNLSYDHNWGDERLYKLDINYKHYFSENFSLLVGPSVNLYESSKKITDKYGSLLHVPYSIYTTSDSNPERKYSSWIGFNIGVSYKL